MKIIAFLLVTTFTFPAFTAVKQDKYNIDIKFSYKNKNKKVRHKARQIMSLEDSQWLPLLPEKNGVVLLGKIKKRKDGLFKVEYLVMDTKRKPLALQELGVIANLNERSEVASGDSLNSVDIKLRIEKK